MEQIKDTPARALSEKELLNFYRVLLACFEQEGLNLPESNTGEPKQWSKEYPDHRKFDIFPSEKIRKPYMSVTVSPRQKIWYEFFVSSAYASTNPEEYHLDMKNIPMNFSQNIGRWISIQDFLKLIPEIASFFKEELAKN